MELHEELASTNLYDVPQSSTETSHAMYMVGFIKTNIVGVQYFGAIRSLRGRQMVGLVREPLNPHDEHAIQVFDIRSMQIGYIERSVAAILSPYIDVQLIAVRGIVGDPRSQQVNAFRVPCEVHVFATLSNFSYVKCAFLLHELNLICDEDLAFWSSEALVVQELRKETGVMVLDDVFELVDKNAKKKGNTGSMEPPKEVINTELLKHQKEGLWWLVDRENSAELPPFWVEKDGKYVNILTNDHTLTRPVPLNGGIFADDMGLGKTLTLLSLIALDKSDSLSDVERETLENVDEQVGREEDGVSVLNHKKRRRLTENSAHTNAGRRKRDKTKAMLFQDKSSLEFCRKNTLIVCPPAVLSTWVTQLEEHTHHGSLRVYLYYGVRSEDKCKAQIETSDIVLTTYGTLASENRNTDTLVMKINWWRVILDEAHMVKNRDAKKSAAVIALKAKNRWAVTGTPIQNGSYDLFSLMCFLRFKPFSMLRHWKEFVQDPLSRGARKGLSRLQVLMSTISLRRTKGMALVGLPSLTIETCHVDLSEEERNLYDEMEKEAKNIFQLFIDRDCLTKNCCMVLCTILRLRQICDGVALCPMGIQSLIPSCSFGDVSSCPELLNKMMTILQDSEDVECPICFSLIEQAVITCCAHLFCRRCISKTLLYVNSRCPMCRRPLCQSDLYSAPEEDAKPVIPSITESSKVSMLLKHLASSKARNPATKSVVFSQFHKMLKLLEDPLRAAGYKFLKLDGTMSATKRARVIKEFAAPGPTVLLATLRASGAGINLQAASRVYLLEPWWNYAVEEQAVNRVYRIGQHEDVTVVRFIARNTIEERILELQDKRKKIAMEGFGGKRKNSLTAISAGDLRMLVPL